jgi:GNAT superfamily N-acetyltransferase
MSAQREIRGRVSGPQSAVCRSSDHAYTCRMRIVRRAISSDLAALEELYLHLNPDRPTLSSEAARRIFDQILTRPGCYLFVCAVGDALAATCMLATVPNLMRGGRPHALLENVVTHPLYRRQGHGRAVVAAALAAAWDEGAHHVLLMSGRQDPAVRLFYESCGFEPGVKAGYVARSPNSA